MRKYIEITKIYIKTQMVWRADTIFNMLFTISRVIFAVILWKMVFAGRDILAGFTYQTMLTYYIISVFLGQMEQSRDIGYQMNEQIRNGTFSKYMVLPVDMKSYFLAMQLGKMIYYLAFDLLAVIVWVFLFRIQFTITTDVKIVLFALGLTVMGFYFMIQINYYLGLLTLKYEDIGTFLMIKDNIMALITGAIIPLALFPEEVIMLMKIFPFYYVTYLPSMLLLGRCEEEVLIGFVVLVCWCVIMHFLIQATWQSYRKKYDGVGV